MADHGLHPEDFSALWGAQDEHVLHPARPEPPRSEAVEPPQPADRAHLSVVDQQVRETVARLAQAIATNQNDVVRKADLAAIRSDMEGAFSQQLAVALYELLASSNDRFTAA